MARQATLVLVGVAVLLACLVSRWNSNGSGSEIARLKQANAQLQRQLEARDAQLAIKASLPLGGSSGGSSGSSSSSSTAATVAPDCAPTAASGATKGQAQPRDDALLAAQLLDLHSHWDWRAIAKEMLLPFAYIDRPMLENAVRTCFENGTMYCMRAQVRNGELYITDYRAVFFDRHYAPARVMPLLDVLRRHKIPDVDIVVAAVDEPRVKMKVEKTEWTKAVLRYPGAAQLRKQLTTPLVGLPREVQLRPDLERRHPEVSLPPPLFSSTTNRAHVDLSWPDFSFYMPNRPHKLRTPPWSKLHPQMLRESSTIPWASKIPLAVHTGNVGSPYRKRLAKAAEAHPEEILVNELFIGDHGKIRSTCAELGLDKKGGFQQHKCFMTFVEQCSYKYLLNSASIGYANKFKYLLLCGSVVIYVRDGMVHKEFYEYGLLPGVHYVAVDTAADVPAMVRWLKEHDDYARAVALAGRARMATLTTDAVADFTAELLTQYSRLQLFRVSPSPGAVRINCEDDLWRHYARDAPWMNHYLNMDNATCIVPPDLSDPRTFGPPGWGGAYRGSRCAASPRTTCARSRSPTRARRATASPRTSRARRSRRLTPSPPRTTTRGRPSTGSRCGPRPRRGGGGARGGG